MDLFGHSRCSVNGSCEDLPPFSPTRKVDVCKAKVQARHKTSLWPYEVPQNGCPVSQSQSSWNSLTPTPRSVCIQTHVLPPSPTTLPRDFLKVSRQSNQIVNFAGAGRIPTFLLLSLPLPSSDLHMLTLRAEQRLEAVGIRTSKPVKNFCEILFEPN